MDSLFLSSSSFSLPSSISLPFSFLDSRDSSVAICQGEKSEKKRRNSTEGERERERKGARKKVERQKKKERRKREGEKEKSEMSMAGEEWKEMERTFYCSSDFHFFSTLSSFFIFFLLFLLLFLPGTAALSLSNDCDFH